MERGVGVSVGGGGDVAVGVAVDVGVAVGVGRGVAEGTMVGLALWGNKVTVAVCVGAGASVAVAVRVARSVRLSAWALVPQAVSNKHKHTRRTVVTGAMGSTRRLFNRCSLSAHATNGRNDGPGLFRSCLYWRQRRFWQHQKHSPAEREKDAQFYLVRIVAAIA